jgi:CheY-like chemotaxis protein
MASLNIKELGLSGYIRKPVKQSKLRATINSSLGLAEIEKSKSNIKAEPLYTEQSKRILLVEDNEDNKNLILAYLRKTPHKIDTAENGKIAVEKFKSGSYDLVLMDIEMPVMDGYAATKEIRKWEKYKSMETTPVIALTAHAMKEHEQKSIDAGCNGHVIKPIKKARLMETINKYNRVK